MRGLLLLLVAVLGAIGIGVAAEAIAGAARYGPAGARFTAVFPAPATTRTTVLHGRGGSAVTISARGGRESLSVEAATTPLPPGRPAPAFASTMALVLHLPGGRRRLTRSPTTIAGHAAATGVACAAPPQHRCAGVLEGPALATRHGGTVFAASARAPSAGAVRALLSSIRPSGR